MIKNAIICDKCKNEVDIDLHLVGPPSSWGEFLINGYKYHLCPKCANEMRQWINAKN